MIFKKILLYCYKIEENASKCNNKALKIRRYAPNLASTKVIKTSCDVLNKLYAEGQVTTTATNVMKASCKKMLRYHVTHSFVPTTLKKTTTRQKIT